MAPDCSKKEGRTAADLLHLDGTGEVLLAEAFRNALHL